MRRINPFILVFITIFSGSVFLTSGKFVNETNSIKYYFVVVSLLVTTGIVACIGKQISFTSLKIHTIYWGILIVCFLQAGYGLFQFLGRMPSNNAEFSVTGSFDNPAGFAAVLAIGFPIGLLLFINAKTVLQLLLILILVDIGIAVFLSGSRAGVLAILLSSFTFFISQTTFIEIFRRLRFYKLFTVLVICFFVGTAFILFYKKKDSANGRLLIWNVSSEMIRDKPVVGHGINSFQVKYMDYQAEYFKDNPASEFVLLADNVKHPFNEHLKIAVEFGLVGLIIVLLFILFILWKIIKSKNENRKLVLSGLTSFLVLACFSYPLQYVAVWILLAFYLSIILPSTEISINNTPISIFARSVIVIGCLFALFYAYQQICVEIKWKTIAVNSLRGNTEKMLPEYRKLYLTVLKRNPFFLYNYGAELNVAGRFDESIAILTECKRRFADYDLQMVLADNYSKKGELGKAIQIYQHASNMIPCRFLPLYQIFEIYKETGEKEMALMYANEIVNKNVKIPSFTVNYIISEAQEYYRKLK